jgi:hypothetical protein
LIFAHAKNVTSGSFGNVVKTPPSANEECFSKKDIQIFRNIHIWSDVNPESRMQSTHLQQFSVEVWTVIVEGCFIGPYVLLP